MKVIMNKAILGSILLGAQTVSAEKNYEDYEMKMYNNEHHHNNEEEKMNTNPVFDFYDDLDKEIEEEEENEEYFLISDDIEEDAEEVRNHNMDLTDAEEEDYFELVDTEMNEIPSKLRGRPSNMTNTAEVSSRSQYYYPPVRGYTKYIEDNKCKEFQDFNVGFLSGHSEYRSKLNQWLSEKPGSDVAEAGWSATGHWSNPYFGFTRACPGLFKMDAPGPISCPDGSHIKSEAECIEAGLAVGGTLRDSALVVGDWRHVPYYCSIQSGGDMSIHFNTREGYNDGGYSSVCAQLYN